MWQESASTAPDPFAMDTVTTGSPTAAGGTATTPAIAIVCNLAQVTIPDGSPNGITALESTLPTVASLSGLAYQSEWCGSNMGYTNQAFSMSVTCKSLSIIFIRYVTLLSNVIHLTLAARQPFNLGVWTDPATALGTGGTGFNLDYTQVLNIKRNQPLNS